MIGKHRQCSTSGYFEQADCPGSEVTLHVYIGYKLLWHTNGQQYMVLEGLELFRHTWHCNSSYILHIFIDLHCVMILQESIHSPFSSNLVLGPIVPRCQSLIPCTQFCWSLFQKKKHGTNICVMHVSNDELDVIVWSS